ncbi:MAG: pyruvate kinase [Trueperaceae bacterium]
MHSDSAFHRDPKALFTTLSHLRDDVVTKGEQRLKTWQAIIERKDFLLSAENLAHYLELRKHDLRPLQAGLSYWGLSSLGRTESRVLPQLDATLASLAAVTQSKQTFVRPEPATFEAGLERLRAQKRLVFGRDKSPRRVRIMVTMPSEAATNKKLIEDLLEHDMNVARINCAHDNAEVWGAMISNIRAASKTLDKPCRILMDLAGPKVRTRQVTLEKKCHKDDIFYLAVDEAALEGEGVTFDVPEVLEKLQVGHRVFFDDGQLASVVEEKIFWDDEVVAVKLRVTHVSPKGKRLKKDKGINFPDVDLSLSPLTAKDLEDLDFVVEHADSVSYSFVQRPEDVVLLQTELHARLGRKSLLPLVLKIETRLAVANLPRLIVAAAAKQPLAVMIARGDLAVELGFERLAEMQEEILWLCEAAHVPVIWATQVLESLAKKGIPSRAEVTDAAMAERAECVMLNKGPYIVETVALLDNVLKRMQEHQTKKTAQLKALKSWVK